MYPLRALLEHHIWATHRLLEHCESLGPAARRVSLAGTFGAVGPTLVHIVAEDQRYLERITGEVASVPVVEADQLDPAALAVIFEGHAQRWAYVLEHLQSISVTLPARGPWPAVPNAESLILLEAIQHGNDHRTHVITVLSNHGYQFPILDGWSFWRERVLT